MGRSDRLLRQVRDRLEPDESVLDSLIGLVGEGDADGLKTISMFATTDKRLVLLTKRMVGYELEGFAYAGVSSFEMREGTRGHELSFLASGNRVWIVGQFPVLSPGQEDVAPLPPAPDGPWGWSDIPYIYTWGRETDRLLSRTAGRRELVPLPSNQPVIIYENVPLYVASGLSFGTGIR